MCHLGFGGIHDHILGRKGESFAWSLWLILGPSFIMWSTRYRMEESEHTAIIIYLRGYSSFNVLFDSGAMDIRWGF